MKRILATLIAGLVIILAGAIQTGAHHPISNHQISNNAAHVLTPGVLVSRLGHSNDNAEFTPAQNQRNR